MKTIIPESPKRDFWILGITWLLWLFIASSYTGLLFIILVVLTIHTIYKYLTGGYSKPDSDNKDS